MWALLLVIVALALYVPHSHCSFFSTHCTQKVKEGQNGGRESIYMELGSQGTLLRYILPTQTKDQARPRPGPRQDALGISRHRKVCVSDE